MNSRTRLILLAILGLGAFPAPKNAMAQSIPSHYQFLETRQEAGIFSGSMSPGTGRFGYGPASGIAVGGWYGLGISGPIGLEGAVTYLPTERAIIDPGRDEGDQNIGSMASDLVMIDARLRFSLTGDRSWRKLAPFIQAGGGFAFDVSGDNQDQEVLLQADRFKFGTSFVGILGGGVRWFPGEHLFFRADAMMFLWQLETPVGFSAPARGFRGVEETEWVSGSSFSAGLGFRF
jgi:hypothetical protein